MISIVLPCRNEEEAIGFCIQKIKKYVQEPHEIIVSDSSRDQSARIAKELGAKVIKHNQKGYGRAIQHGIDIAQGDYIVMLDADMTYDCSDIPRMIELLREGNDFVIGDRFGKKIERGAMPLLHGFLGQPLFAALLWLRCQSKIRDPHCGLRAFSRKAYDQMKLRKPGMEFASEMIVKAHQKKLKMRQIPTQYFIRLGDSKLHTFRDGWRHVRYLLVG